MKLIPKAKPVRIRISSGGQEHSSLDTLLENFDIESLLSLYINGSLSRWLNQIGAFNIADKLSKLQISDFDNITDDELESFVRAFFNDDISTVARKIVHSYESSENGGQIVRWHQIAYIVDREGYATTYIDGVEAASFKISEVEGTIDGTDAANLIFGADGFGQYGMNFGEFDDIRIYRNPLSKKIIEEMYYQKLLSGVNYEAQRTLSTDAGAVYSEENKVELSEELAKSKEYATLFQLWV
jgi:hypothetical protein